MSFCEDKNNNPNLLTNQISFFRSYNSLPITCATRLFFSPPKDSEKLKMPKSVQSEHSPNVEKIASFEESDESQSEEDAGNVTYSQESQEESESEVAESSEEEEKEKSVDSAEQTKSSINNSKDQNLSSSEDDEKTRVTKPASVPAEQKKAVVVKSPAKRKRVAENKPKRLQKPARSIAARSKSVPATSRKITPATSTPLKKKDQKSKKRSASATATSRKTATKKARKMPELTTKDMIIRALKDLKNKKGSTKVAIKKYIGENFGEITTTRNAVISKLLREADSDGWLTQTAGKGLSAASHWKLSDDTKKEITKQEKASLAGEKIKIKTATKRKNEKMTSEKDVPVKKKKKPSTVLPAMKKKMAEKA